MRKIILSAMVSLDGFIEDKERDIGWHVWDNEMDEYMNSFLDSVDTILLGRRAYELMAGYWPSAPAEDALITDKMNSLPKIVFSKTLDRAEWNNSTIIKDNIPEKISALKRQAGKKMVLFGGAEISWFFMHHFLIDEFHIIVNPILLGNGKPLFNNTGNRIKLKLSKTRSFNCGNTVLLYEPNQKIHGL